MHSQVFIDCALASLYGQLMAENSSNLSNASDKSLLHLLQQLMELAEKQKELSIAEVFHVMEKRGYATILLICSLPFCIPIQIPGFSTPFGFILGFIGLRLAFAKHLWWPKWLLERKVSSAQVSKLVSMTTGMLHRLESFLHPRLLPLSTNPLALRIHGITIFLLALLLSLPLPIPMSNMLSALPIFFFSLGLLEDDGVMIIIGYVFAVICVASFTALFIFGKAYLSQYLAL